MAAKESQPAELLVEGTGENGVERQVPPPLVDVVDASNAEDYTSTKHLCSQKPEITLSPRPSTQKRNKDVDKDEPKLV
eukprot:2690301-Amphidinium_carterae.1